MAFPWAGYDSPKLPWEVHKVDSGMCKIVSYSIVINGKLTIPFEAKKGLEKWDPLPPFLFVHVMEYFDRVLRTLDTAKNFKYHPKCSKLKFIQLGFADDLLLLCRGDITSITHLYDCFKMFSDASWLIANLSRAQFILVGEESNITADPSDTRS